MRTILALSAAISLVVLGGQATAKGQGGGGANNPNRNKSSVELVAMCKSDGAVDILVIDQTDDNGPAADIDKVSFACTTKTGPGKGGFESTFDSGEYMDVVFEPTIINDVEVSAAMLTGEGCDLGLIESGDEWKAQAQIIAGEGNNLRKNVTDNCEEQIKP